MAADFEPATGTVSLTTAWRRVAPVDGVYLMRLDVLDAAGRTVATHTRVLGYMVWPVADWARNAPVAEHYALEPGTRLSPGRYTVRMRLARLGADAPVRVDAVTRDPYELGSFVVGRASG